MNLINDKIKQNLFKVDYIRFLYLKIHELQSIYLYLESCASC